MASPELAQYADFYAEMTRRFGLTDSLDLWRDISERLHQLTPEPEDPEVPRRILAEAIRVVPRLADAPVVSSWWGLRPMTPDERPLIGRIRDGLIVATGHGSEGVINGAGTAELVAATVFGEHPPFEAAAFDPLRFG